MTDFSRPKKKKNRKVNYTVLMIPDRPEFPIRKSAVNRSRVVARRTFTVLGILLAIVLLAGAGTMIYFEEQEKLTLNEQIASLEESLSEEQAVSAELGSKVDILSETLNQKNQEEEEKEEIEAEKYIPTGIPVDSSASCNPGFDASSSAQILIFTATEGVDVIATASGTVSYIGSDDTYLNVIMIDHGNGYVSVYRNSSEPKVKVGAEVIRGSILFEMDADSTTLGYQIKFGTAYIDPSDMMEVYG